MRKLCVLGLVMCFFFSCGYQAGVIQKAEKSYLRFVSNSNLDGVAVTIDKGQPFVLGASDGNTLFQTTPGQHSIRVVRNDRVVVDREIFLQSQATFEVIVP